MGDNKKLRDAIHLSIENPPVDLPDGIIQRRGFFADVNHHNNWNVIPKVYTAWQRAFDGAIVRSSYGSDSDRHFISHVTGLLNGNKLPPLLGLYHFVRYHQSAEDQLRVFLKNANEVRRLVLDELGGNTLNDLASGMLLVLNLEWNEKFDGPIDTTKYLRTVTKMTRQLHDEGHQVIFHTSPGFWDFLGRPRGWLDVPWWIAHWAPLAPNETFTRQQIKGVDRIDIIPLPAVRIGLSLESGRAANVRPFTHCWPFTADRYPKVLWAWQFTNRFAFSDSGLMPANLRFGVVRGESLPVSDDGHGIDASQLSDLSTQRLMSLAKRVNEEMARRLDSREEAQET